MSLAMISKAPELHSPMGLHEVKILRRITGRKMTLIDKSLLPRSSLLVTRQRNNRGSKQKEQQVRLRISLQLLLLLEMRLLKYMWHSRTNGS
jgi:hypothetical protein